MQNLLQKTNATDASGNPVFRDIGVYIQQEVCYLLLVYDEVNVKSYKRKENLSNWISSNNSFISDEKTLQGNWCSCRREIYRSNIYDPRMSSKCF